MVFPFVTICSLSAFFPHSLISITLPEFFKSSIRRSTHISTNDAHSGDPKSSKTRITSFLSVNHIPSHSFRNDDNVHVCIGVFSHSTDDERDSTK